MPSFKSGLKDLHIRQNSKAEILALGITVASVVNGTNGGVIEGSKYVTVVKNGTGDYTITLNSTARRPLIFLGGCAVGQAFLRLNSVPTSSAIRVVIESDAGVNSDFDFQCAVLVFNSATER